MNQCEEKSITQAQFCNREFKMMHDKMNDLEDGIKSLRNLVITQFGALGMVLVAYVLNQIK